ncbi:MAG: hypothetical protein AAFU77_01070 [Myxococcota bacterium]
MRNLLYGAFVVVCLFSIIWPGYAWFGNRVTPLIFGIPFSLMWNVGWVAASCFALLAYDMTEPKDT